MSSRGEQMRNVFASRVERVHSALEQSRQERRRYDTAAATIQRLQTEVDEAKREMQGLPGAAAKALLTSEDDEGAQSVDGLKSRYRELERIVSDRQQRLKDAEKVMGGEDAHAAESLSLQKLQATTRQEIGEARRERDQLVTALDEALSELEQEAAEAFELRPIHTRAQKEAS